MSMQGIVTQECWQKARVGSRNVSRCRKNTNHIICKRNVEKAKDTGRAIGREDLKGIRKSQKRRGLSDGAKDVMVFLQSAHSLN